MNQSVFNYSYEMKVEHHHKLWRNFFIIFGTVFVNILIFKFLIFPVFVRSSSMENSIPKNSAVFVSPLPLTIDRGDIVYVNRLDDVHFSKVQKVINLLSSFVTLNKFEGFEFSTKMTGTPQLRRVIALPGDTIYMKNYVVYIKAPGNSSFLTEFEFCSSPYDVKIVSAPDNFDELGIYSDMDPYTLKEGEYFVLSDDRCRAADSRVWKSITENDIGGKALMIYFPFGKIKLL